MEFEIRLLTSFLCKINILESVVFTSTEINPKCYALCYKNFTDFPRENNLLFHDCGLNGTDGSPLQYSGWRIPRTEEPGKQSSVGSQGVGHDPSDSTHTHIRLLSCLKIPREASSFQLLTGQNLLMFNYCL